MQKRPKLRHFFSTHKDFLLLTYMIIYLPWFEYLEHHVTTHFHVISSPLDQYIPFCEYFVLPYYAWFFYMGIGIVFIALKDPSTCWKMGFHMITGMTIFLIVCTVYPNGLMLRPETFAHDNFCVDLVKHMYAIDTPTNVIPSLHVYNSVSIHMALTATPLLKKRPKVRAGSFILMVLIILSTVFIKQHSVIDVLVALFLAGIMYLVAYIWIPKALHYARRKTADVIV